MHLPYLHLYIHTLCYHDAIIVLSRRDGALDGAVMVCSAGVQWMVPRWCSNGAVMVQRWCSDGAVMVQRWCSDGAVIVIRIHIQHMCTNESMEGTWNTPSYKLLPPVLACLLSPSCNNACPCVAHFTTCHTCQQSISRSVRMPSRSMMTPWHACHCVHNNHTMVAYCAS